MGINPYVSPVGICDQLLVPQTPIHAFCEVCAHNTH